MANRFENNLCRVSRKLIAGILVLCTSISSLSAQKKFNVTIILGKDIDRKSFKASYDNGLNQSSGFMTERDTLNLKDIFYSKYLTLNVGCSNSGESFFIGDKPARIYLYMNKRGWIDDSAITGAKYVYDTSGGIFRELRSLREVTGYDSFMNQNATQLHTSDSLFKEFLRLTREFHTAAMQVLKNEPDDYFSFWYYKNQIVLPDLSFFSNDTAYLKKLLSYYESVFYPQYKNVEGGELLRLLTNSIYPLKTENIAPDFTTKDMKGKEISLKDFRGKYLLLDFWATWCGPCLEELPDIKALFDKYNQKNLATIGISIDYYKDALIKYLKKNNDKLGWHQIFDEEKKISKMYGVGAVPSLILIDPHGKIVYKNEGKDDAANQEIEKFLNE